MSDGLSSTSPPPASLTNEAPLEARGQVALPTTHEAPGLWPERFRLIDGWRGLAALAVVVHHVTGTVLIGGPAVLLFFVISGYCIAASADSCRRRGLGFGTFMLRRVRRIYPPYLLSLGFWAATRAAKWAITGQNELDRPITHWIQNITLTQWLSLLGDPAESAASNPTLFVAAYWSLCYEEQFYLLMGFFLLLAHRIGASIRSMVVAFMVIGLIWNILLPEIAYGLFIEYWAMFGFGVLVFYRLCRMANPLHRRAVDVFLLTITAASIYLRWFAGIQWHADAPELTGIQRAEMRVVYEEIVIAAGFGLLLIATRPLDERVSSRPWYRPLAALGHITFSLYLIHQFLLNFVRGIVETGLRWVHALPPRNPGETETWYSLTLQIALHVVIASVFWYFCERPFLNKSLLPAPARPPTAPSGVASS